MMNLMIFLSMMINIMFTMMKSPASMGMILMIQIMLSSLMMSLFSINYWFSYILFIVMIGGLMVLFIYMTSLAPNSMFKINFKMMIKIFMMITFMYMMFNLMNYTNFMIKNNDEINKFMYLFNNNWMLMKLYNFPINKLTWLMIIYLLMTLIIAAKLVKTNLGSLRQLN